MSEENQDDVIYVKFNEVVPVRCCCAKESHPMPFIPGEYIVECKHKLDFLDRPKEIIITMFLDEKGHPNIKTRWR